MTEIETLIRSELDRRYPTSKLEPDWDGVLQRVGKIEEPSAERRPHRGISRSTRRRTVFALVAAVLAATAATLTLVAPWRGGPSFVEQALAALGGGRYVHAVVGGIQPQTEIVTLASGRTRPVTRRIEWVYDTKTGTISDVFSVNGVAMFSEQNGTPDPAVTGFATGYRKALANGTAQVVGETSVNGQKAKIIRFPIRLNDGSAILFYEDVLVATGSHQPLLIRYRSFPNVRAARAVTYRVVSIDSSNTPPTLTNPHPQPSLTGSATDIRQLSPSEASAALGRTALWPGRIVSGATLQKLRLQRVTTSVLHSYPPGNSVRGLRFDYRTVTGSPLVIQEAATPQYPYGFYSVQLGTGVPVPRVGEAVLTHLQTGWQAQLRERGLFVTIRSANKNLVIAAARALTPAG